MTTKKTNIKIDKTAIIRKMIDNKIALIKRVQSGENLGEVAKDLGVKIVRPV